jgi:ribosomal protein L16/L10AE
MGKGKGSISHWVARVRPGQLLFEFSGITKPQLDEIFQKLCKKTSIGLSIIS